MVVYKYLLTHGVNTFSLPSGSMPLKVAFQGGEIVLWVLIPAGCTSHDTLRILVAFTGEFINDGPVTYISSDENDGIVFHAFELN